MKNCYINIYNNHESFLTFIGASRSGTTLLGEIINFHPQCIVSTEERFIINTVLNSCGREESYLNLIKSGMEQLSVGLENTKKFSDTIVRYQPKWRSFAHLSLKPEFKKTKIKVLGDKKAGGVAHCYSNNPKKTKEVIENLRSPCLIHLLRHPINSARSALNSHFDQIKSFDEALVFILKPTKYAFEAFEEIQCKKKRFYYEDLISKSRSAIIEVFNFLEVSTDEKWLNYIVGLINKEQEYNYTPEEVRLMKNTIKKYGIEKEMERYL